MTHKKIILENVIHNLPEVLSVVIFYYRYYRHLTFLYSSVQCLENQSKLIFIRHGENKHLSKYVSSSEM